MLQIKDYFEKLLHFFGRGESREFLSAWYSAATISLIHSQVRENFVTAYLEKENYSIWKLQIIDPLYTSAHVLFIQFQNWFLRYLPLFFSAPQEHNSVK